MKQLAWLCEHGEVRAHLFAEWDYRTDLVNERECPGGQLVPADARVGEKVAEALDADHAWYRCTGNHDYPAAARIVLSAIAQLAEAGSQ